MDTSNLTEYQKTLLSIYKVDGINGLRQYFRNHEKISDMEKIEEKVTAFLQDLGEEATNTTVSDKVADGEKNIPSETEVVRDSVPVTQTTEKENGNRVMTVTFADGSTKDIEVQPDGVVVNPVIPTGEPIVPTVEESEIKSQEETVEETTNENNG